MMVVPVLPARADGQALAGLVEATVDGTTDVVNETVQGTTDAVDETDSTGTVLDEPVDDTTDLVDGLADSVITIVDETEDSVTEVVDDDTDPDPGETTIPSPGTTTTADPSTETARSDTSEVVVAEQENSASAIPEDTASGRTTSTDRSEGLGSLVALSVLAAANGVSELSDSEMVDVASVTDTSLYGRLIGWLTSAQSGVFGLLAGPLLSLEILLRALTSAGSGLVAPLSLLSAYLVRIIRQLRVRRALVV